MPDRFRVAVVSVGLLTATAAACSGADDTERSAERVCALLAPSTELTELASDFDPTDVPRALNRLDAMEVQLELIRDVAPTDAAEWIDDELVYVRALRSALQDVDPDDAAAVADAVNSLDDEARDAGLASADLQAFQAVSCGTTTAPAG